MTAPRVSVVIPAYEQAGFIDATVRSVLDQSGVDVELVVADHSSGDGTWEALQAYAGDPRVRLLRTPAGGGAPANWKAVTEAATGELLKLLPGDDELLPGTLARQAALFGDSGTVLVAGRRNVVDAAGKTMARGRGLQGIRGPMPGTEAIRVTVRSGTNVFGEPGAVMMRRDALERAGGWDGTHPYAIDLATYIRVLEQGGFVPDDGVASTFRVSAGQWSVALARSQSEQMAELFDAVRERLPDAISDADLRRGKRRAKLLAQQRRLVYLVMKGRMG